MTHLTLQIIAGINLLICIGILFRLLFEWGEPHIKYLGCLTLMVAVDAVSYYLEVNALTEAAAWSATKIEYFSAPCLGAFTLLFGLEYIGKKVRSRALLYSLFVIPAAITLAVTLEPLTHLYVRNMAWAAVGGIHRLVFLEVGPLYIVNFVYSFGLDLVITLVVCLAFLRKSRRNWPHCMVFVFSIWLPVLSRVTGWSGLFPPLDTFYMASTLSIAVMYWYVKRYRQPEWYNLGWEAVIGKLNEAVLVVNNDMEIINVNPAFFRFFPVFRRLDTTEAPVQLPQFIEYIKDQMVESIPTTIFEDVVSTSHNHNEGEFTILQDYVPPTLQGEPQNEALEMNLVPKPQTFTLTRQIIKVGDSVLGQTIVLSDVSSYRKMIGEIVMLKQKAEEASQSKSQFLATMSHEIRTPLNAILGITEILLQQKQSALTYADLERIHNSGSGLLSIINDILDISKIETGNLELIPVDYLVSSMVNDAVQLNIVRIGTKPIAFELDIDETIPARLTGDELRVRQILNNQLSNAIKYTQEGRVSLKIKWTPEEKAGEGRLTIQVTDTGQGIKKEDMGKLFAQYGQINAQANRNIEGTGLGLSITKNLVEMMGGMIQVESKYRRGSVFTAAVRQKAAGKAPLGKEAAQNLKHFRFIESRSIRDKKLISIHVPEGKALVVDDVETNLYVARGLLLPYGLTIDCVKSGQEAIDRIRQEPSYDIVFMDHMMPGMDGIETTGIIRAIPGEYVRSLPIIALTANAIVGMRDMFLGKGFNDYLSKPISRTRLDEILVQWIPRAKQQKPGGAEDAGAAGAAAKTAGAETAEAAPAQQEELTIEGIDVKQGMVMTGGSAAAYREILAVFCKDAAARLEMLVKAPTEKELLSFTTNVHALKSASANIGAAGASQKAAALEGAAKQKDLGVIEANLDDFRVTLEALLQAIHTSLEPKETDAPGEDPAITDTDRKQLTELREALRAGEIRVMDTLLRALKERRINSRLRQAVASISDCVLLSDFQDAIALINELPL